jgi:transketolase
MDTLREVFATCRVVATIEEHSTWGGFGGAVSEWLTDQWPAPRARLLRLGTTPDEFLHVTAEQEEAREHYGLTAEAVAGRIAQAAGV